MKTTIKIELLTLDEKGVHLLMDAKVNGIPAKFLIDTGASQTVMDKERAAAFIGNASVDSSNSLSKGLGTDSMESFTTNLDSIQFGKFKITGQEIVLLDLSHVNNSYVEVGHNAIDGVLGGEILKAHKAVIDYAKESITFSD